MNPLDNAAKAGELENPILAAAAELAQVEEMLRKESRAAVALLYDVLSYTLDAGGKRLRPALVILSAQAFGAGGARPIRQAVVAEMVHTASLLHDDVLDRSDMRRGRPTVGICWGNSISIIAGDYLLSRALRLLAEDGDLQIIQAYSSMMVEMCEGEALQAIWRDNGETPQSTYLEIIGRKTATFFATCCRVGGIVGDANPIQLESLAGYGYALGIAFQIADDVRDLVGDRQTLGKPNGNDLREGKATLPLLLAMERASDAERSRLSALLTQPNLTDDQVCEAGEIVWRYEAPQAAMELARSYAAKAEDHLRAFPESTALAALRQIPRYAVSR